MAEIIVGSVQIFGDNSDPENGLLKDRELYVNTVTDFLFYGKSGVSAPVKTLAVIGSHAASHASNGSDPIAPSDIGAAPLNSPAFTGTPTVGGAGIVTANTVAGGDVTGTFGSLALSTSGVSAGTYSGLLSVTVDSKGRVTALTKLDDSKTLVIPGATDGASGAQLLTYARTLKEVRVLCRTAAFADAVPSAPTTLLIKKVVSGVTTPIVTISGITVATTTYDVNPDVTVESGAYVYAQISGSNNGVAVVNAVLVWG